MGCAQVKQPRVKFSPEQINELEACREAVLQCIKFSNEGLVQNSSSKNTLNVISCSEKRFSDCSIPTKNSLNLSKKQ